MGDIIYYRHYSYLYRKIILPNGIMQHLVFGFLFPYVYGPLAYRLQFAVSFGAYANATQVVSVLHFSQHLDDVFLVDWLVWFLKSYLQFKLQRQYPSKNSSSSNPKMSFCISSNVRRHQYKTQCVSIRYFVPPYTSYSLLPVQIPGYRQQVLLLGQSPSSVHSMI